ncbi:MAG TPA: hypothetical protein VJJ52_00405 [Candidatus Nanoarchaeia archaeon]|nr:hypothetical protein [Candidatus Nanoarchaeia archaeon]
MPLVESFSGIRGIYGKDLNESVAVRYAYSYLTFLRNKTKKKTPTVVIGMDTRPSGQKLKEIIIGMLDCNFIDIGIAPTPIIEFAVRYFEADGGIIITASHNEPFWNGFKFLSDDGSVLSEKDMYNVIRNSKFLKDFHKVQERKILEKNGEAVKKYTEFIFDIIGHENMKKIKNSRQKIVLDPNGGAGAIAKKILESAGVEVVGVNMPYGEFKRQVEPTEDAMVYLKNVIDENKADFAAGFDCDADRVEILMKDGQLLSGNYILALVVQEILLKTRNPKSQTIVVNDATSNIVRVVAEKFGAKIKEVEVGETNVVEEIKKLKSIVGGEGSSGGAIIWPSRCRDGILTLLTILSTAANKEQKLHDIVNELPQYYTLRKKLEFNSIEHDKIKKFLKNYYLKKRLEIKETGGIKGGLKVIVNKDSFVWFRASKTESNVFRIISDSNKYNESHQLLDEAVNLFKKVSK